MLIVTASAVTATVDWPAPPAEARVRHVGAIDCGDLDRQRGFWGRVGDLFGGKDSDDIISLPMDVLAVSDKVFLTCQEVPGLIEVDPVDRTFKLHECDDVAFVTPIALALSGDDILISDSEAAVVFRYRDGAVEPFITEGLVRPTGLACLPQMGRIYVVDTGAHAVKVFDLDGRPVDDFGSRGEHEGQLNFPTFAWAGPGGLLVNDTLNYQIKRFSTEGALLSAFGTEGDRAGAFARPKGVAADANGNVWVVDAIFDNIQIFDEQGLLLLVIGSRGRAAGQFWSPSGISIRGRDVHIADTFNNRIQILEILGGKS